MRKSLKAFVRTGSALFLLVVIAGIAGCGSGGSQPGGNSSPAISATPTPTGSTAPAATPTSAAAPSSVPPPVVTTPPPTAAPPAVQPAPPPPHTVAPPPQPGCHPLSNEGTCYEPGEFCRETDHGVTGVAGDGKTITCEDKDGWRWEPA